MRFNLGIKPQNGFGLDISASSLKLLQLDVTKDTRRVAGFAEAALPKGVIVNEEVTDPKTFAFVLQQALDKPAYGKFSAPYVVASLPEAKSFVRVVQIPKMSDSEADSAVPFEAENFIPLPVDQVYLDWQKLSDEGEKMNVLMVAVPREFVDKRLELLDGAGLKSMALEVESQSCHRSVIARGSQETSLILDMSSYHSSIIMVERGNLQFTSTVPIAGVSFTDAIAKALGVSGAKAEEIKRKVGLNNTADYPNIKTALLPVIGNLAAEIKNILKFHGEHSAEPVSKIWLTGGSGQLSNLAEFLASQFSDFSGLEIRPANPWINIANLDNPPVPPQQTLSFATAIGLAMRGGGLV